MKIAHVVNPFKCSPDNSGYLYYAQPITFKTMHVAQLKAKKENIDVKLYSVNYQEDDEIIPEYFIKLPNLKKSTKEIFPTINNNKKLPIIQEIFDLILEKTNTDYIIFTNVDISLQPHFYTEVKKIIESGLDSFIINRRDNIPKMSKGNIRYTEEDLNLLYTETGKKHIGKDCFIIKREILEKIDMKLMFTGYPPWGNKLTDVLKRINPKTKIFKNRFLTFHLGQDKSWNKTNKKHPLWIKNIQISNTIK